jgi:hypothetical protein
LDIFSSIGKFVLPAVKKYLAPAATEFAHGIIHDLSQGKNIKNSMKTRGKTGLKKIRSRILQGKGLHRRLKQIPKPPKKKYKKKRDKLLESKENLTKKKCKVKKGNRNKTKYHDIFS